MCWKAGMVSCVAGMGSEACSAAASVSGVVVTGTCAVGAAAVV